MRRKFNYLSIMIAACVGLLVACVYLDSVDIDQPQPDGTMAPRIKAGEVATFTVKGHMDLKENHEGQRLVFALLAPRSWDIRNNSVVTYRASSVLDFEDVQKMSPIPENASPKNMLGYTWPEALMERFGIGLNRYNDMEWVAWQADEGVEVFNGSQPNYEVTIRTKVGNENSIVNLSFFINYIDDGLSQDGERFKVEHCSVPFTIYDGVGEVIDYTKYRFNTIEPNRALQDDLVTFTFAGEAYDNDLIHCDEIFLEGTAYTEEGGVYPVNVRDARTLMTRANTFSHNYSVTMWPKDFFSIPDNETISRIEYVFTNRDGSVKINKSLSDIMSGETPADDDQPFTFTLGCGY